MGSKSVLYEVSAREFRSIMAPAIRGKIGALEPTIAALCAEATKQWLQKVITDTMRDTRLHDKGGLIEQELRNNARVFGAYSLSSLRGNISAYPWLRIHEYGGDVHPENAEYLAIPIYNALRADGSPKFRDPKSWQRFGSFVYKQKSTGRLFLAYKSKSDGQLKILYILVDKITIPARLGLTWHAEAAVATLYETWATIFIEVAAGSGFEIFWDNA